jgi:hypothetical protein
LAWNQRRRRFEPSIGESVIRRRLPSPRYDQRKAAIQDTTFLRDLELAEENVLAGPADYPIEQDIGGIYYNKTVPGVMLAYEIEGDGVRFLAFSDLFNS